MFSRLYRSLEVASRDLRAFLFDAINLIRRNPSSSSDVHCSNFRVDSIENRFEASLKFERGALGTKKFEIRLSGYRWLCKISFDLLQFSHQAIRMTAFNNWRPERMERGSDLTYACDVNNTITIASHRKASDNTAQSARSSVLSTKYTPAQRERVSASIHIHTMRALTIHNNSGWAQRVHNGLNLVGRSVACSAQHNKLLIHASRQAGRQASIEGAQELLRTKDIRRPSVNVEGVDASLACCRFCSEPSRVEHTSSCLKPSSKQPCSFREQIKPLATGRIGLTH